MIATHGIAGPDATVYSRPSLSKRRNAVPRRPPEIPWPITPVSEPPPAKPPPYEPPPDNPLLERASVTFHTNDDDKDHDTAVGVYVVLREDTIAYIYDEFGHFPDHSDSGPYTLLLEWRAPRHAIRQARVIVGIDPVMLPLGRGDTWRFNFMLDFLFEDGSHQLSKASRLELSTFNRFHEFAVE
jgi:hypothetical protein